VGRFISEDPKKFEAGVNFYAYALNNPVNGNDPYGLDWQASAGVGLLVGGNPIPIVPGPFVGGGTSLGVTSRGQFFIQVQAQGSVGVGIFGGVGGQAGLSHSDEPLPNWLSTSKSYQVDANIGWGVATGGSINYSGGTNVGASTGLGRVGAGFGAAVTAGAVTTTTFATPPLWGGSSSSATSKPVQRTYQSSPLNTSIPKAYGKNRAFF
jgi:hypothetical protein